MDLKGSGVGRTSVEGGDGDRIRRGGDDGQEVLGEDFTMEGVGAVFDKFLGLEGMGSLDGDVGKVGMVWQGLDVEFESWGKGGMTIEGVAEEETIGLEWIGGKKQTADGNGGEVVGFFEGGGSGVTAFGTAMAGEETGDVTFDEMLVEIGEEMGEALVGPAVVV